MFRLPLATFFLLAAANADFVKHVTRQLQGDFDLDAFQFNFAGVNINADIAQEKCPGPWQAAVSCVISDCPQFMDVCPELEVPAENQGTLEPGAAPAEGEATPETMPEPEAAPETMPEMGNSTDMGNMTMEEKPMDEPAAEVMPEVDPADEVPSCEELETEFCEAFVAEEFEDCCMLDCAEPLQELVVCIVKETTGEDRSNCEIPECPTPAPGATGGDAPAPAPADSAAAGVATRVVLLAASAFAFFML